MKRIHVNALQIGDYIIKMDASWLDTPFLKHNFEIKDRQTIEKIQKSNVEYVFIKPRPPETKLPDNLTEKIIETRKETIPNEYMEIKDMAPTFELYKKSVSIVKSVMEDVRAGKIFNSPAVKILTDKIADLTMKNRSLMVNIAKLQSYDDYTFQHSMNVAIFASSLGKLLGLPASDVKILANSGLLHDIGKMLVPKDILNKPAKLTDDEFVIMKNHVTEGYNFLKKNGFSENELKIVVEHHERFDGSGYPNGLKDDEISIFGKIGAVVDIYDAITSDRVYHKGMYPPSAIKMMFSWTDKHINKKIFEFFVSNIGIYPVGTTVLLSTHELAVVANVDKKPLEPLVVIFRAASGSEITPLLYDLSINTVLKKKMVGPVNPENINIPKDVYKIIEGLNTQNS